MSTSNLPPMLTPSLPPEAWESLVRLAKYAGRPLERFLRIEAASGIFLLVASAIALLWANSPWAPSYFHFWQLTLGIQVGEFRFHRSLEWFVNDVLMVIFFFLVGLEIRREVHHGELSEWRRATVPFFAALGGMLAPAIIYLTIAGGSGARSGWGIPTATDIAFAVGILALLGKRVPAALRVLLLALAVIDDLGAIVVIALFYSSGISLPGVLIASLGFGGIVALQKFGVRSKLAYCVPSVVAWAGTYSAGIHPTIAGVVIGLMTPVRTWFGPQQIVDVMRAELEQLAPQTHTEFSSADLALRMRQLDSTYREAQSPAESLIASLHPLVAFGIMPLFAFANAGVQVTLASLDSTSYVVAIAVLVGLVVGKPVGVLLACHAALRFRLGTLPLGLRFPHLVVLGIVAGVGFTMSLFIAQLAFASPQHLAAAKLGVLSASTIAALLAFFVGRALLPLDETVGVARTADEAEKSTEL